MIGIVLIRCWNIIKAIIIDWLMIKLRSCFLKQTTCTLRPYNSNPTSRSNKIRINHCWINVWKSIYGFINVYWNEFTLWFLIINILLAFIIKSIAKVWNLRLRSFLFSWAVLNSLTCSLRLGIDRRSRVSVWVLIYLLVRILFILILQHVIGL